MSHMCSRQNLPLPQLPYCTSPTPHHGPCQAKPCLVPSSKREQASLPIMAPFVTRHLCCEPQVPLHSVLSEMAPFSTPGLRWEPWGPGPGDRSNRKTLKRLHRTALSHSWAPAHGLMREGL